MSKAHQIDDKLVAFHCTGCGNAHMIDKTKWGFNGDFEKPTITPSILVTGTQRLTDEEYDKIMGGEKIVPRPLVCHSFVTDGRIQYLNDCTHDLKGQTVNLEEF